jgi:manganese efflux pump family protein
MSLPEIFLIAVGLAMDAFAVSLGVGTTRFAESARPRLRLAWHFGLFQALMPALGWLVGSAVNQWIAPVDHWIALGLLAFVGVRMIRSGLASDEESHPTDPSRGATLVLLAVATSIDAFAVGLSLALVGVPIVLPAVVIGVVTGSLSLVGLVAGNRLGKTFGKRMEIVGGVILIAIGIRIVISHLFPGV